MKRIFVASPLRPMPEPHIVKLFDPESWQYEAWWAETLQKNLRKAREYCRIVVDAGHRPYAPHLFLTQFLDEKIPAERELGIQLGIQELATCDQLWFWDIPTAGMIQELKFCQAHGIPVMWKGKDPFHFMTEDYTLELHTLAEEHMIELRHEVPRRNPRAAITGQLTTWETPGDERASSKST